MGRKKKIKPISEYPEIAELMMKCSKGDPSAICTLGEFVENTLTGKFGKILEIYFNGKETEIIGRSKQDLVNAPFYLGMISAVKEFALDLEQYVLDKEKAMAPREEVDDGMQEA